MGCTARTRRRRAPPTLVEPRSGVRHASSRNNGGVSTGRNIHAVIFDLGGVLMLNGRPTDVAQRYPDADPEVVTRALMGVYGEDSDHPWHRLERGEISMAQYQRDVRTLLTEAGITPAPSQRPPGQAGSPFRFEPNEHMIALVRDLRRSGLRTAMLTNNVRELRTAWWSVSEWPRLFDDIVDSHEVGMRKPNPEIYRLSASRIGVVPEASVFLDDVLTNVQAADRVGMTGVHVEGAGESAIRRVRDLVGLQHA